nr:calcium/sodium antiporter [Halothermothrix orenii]
MPILVDKVSHEEREVFMEALIHNYLVSFPTLALLITIAIMLYILSKGADILVDEAVKLSLQLGVPKVIIGATIVSLGTTLPEAAVSVLAAINGNPDLALGNAVGSIIADTGLIIGVAALLGSLPVSKMIVNRQGRIQVWAGILLALVSLPLVSGSNIPQWIGWVFIVLLILYIYSSIKWTQKTDTGQTAATSISRGSNANQPTPAQSDVSVEITISEDSDSLVLRIFKLFAGIFLVIGSSKVLIPAVEITAIRIGIPESIIAATLVAFGTSLPELMTAITAVRKGHGELAVGNIVGADILNVLFVVGSAASVTAGGLNVPANFYRLQIPTMVIILVTFRLFSRGRNEEITKKEGIVLFLLYVIYLILNYTWV